MKRIWANAYFSSATACKPCASTALDLIVVLHIDKNTYFTLSPCTTFHIADASHVTAGMLGNLSASALSSRISSARSLLKLGRYVMQDIRKIWNGIPLLVPLYHVSESSTASETQYHQQWDSTPSAGSVVCNCSVRLSSSPKTMP